MLIPGIHHVTAIAGDPQPNLDFYAGILGLRLVKQTVNFDDPSTYHLYYGDAAGSPGTILTFFPYGHDAAHGRPGTGQTTAVSFGIAPESLKHWHVRLKSSGIHVVGPFERFGQPCITFKDPDGLTIDLIGAPSAGPAITAFHSVTLAESNNELTQALLTGQFGYQLVGVEENRTRFQTQSDSPARTIDVLHQPDVRRGAVARGSVHHIAFRTASTREQLEWRSALIAAGHDVTPVMEREYFESIYFREPDGVLFEIATDPPGFAIDEAPNQLGHSLKLPPWLEPQRAQIQAVLPPLRIPKLATHAI